MVFNSPIFLFLFLPVTLGIHLLLPPRLRNHWLLLMSLLFYAWGEVFFVFVMIFSIMVNYSLGLVVAAPSKESRAKIALAATVIFNLGLLATWKYANFAVENLNTLLVVLGLEPVHITQVPLPIGISFFTFQAMSYVIDVYRGEAESQKNPLNVALYISLFPQLIAGPIVRYRDVAQQLILRYVTREDFSYGVSRFIVGLGKKVIIANTLATPADAIFALPSDQLTPAIAWTGALCYTLQIYFDFSGYSDMAIGLGRMLGLRYLENFNYPYVSQSIREFWRRWHISLSTWFRDYLYIPMGGNRGSSMRTYFNLLTVFFLCGLWHGASWTFVIWGLYHGMFQVLERLGLKDVLQNLPRLLRHVYVLLVAIVGWVIFRSETLPQALAMLASMAGFGPHEVPGQNLWLYINPEVAFVLIIGCLGSLPIIPVLWQKRRNLISPNATTLERHLDDTLAIFQTFALFIVFAWCLLSLSASTYNPFIYFRF